MLTPTERLSPHRESQTAAQTSDTTKVPSPWTEAVRIARLRNERRSKGLDASVRALARQLGCSRGRVGELLHIYDAFSSEFILLGDRNVRGEDRLRRLSYRQFREVLKVEAWMTLTSVDLVRRLSEVPHR
jgi:hypothetical protein